MFKKLAKYFAYLLLVLMPLQGFAAASMAVCGGTMHAKLEQKANSMPCHEPISMRLSEHHQNESKTPNLDVCQSICAHLCANFGSLITLPSINLAVTKFSSANKLILPPSFYTSITPANLQRPPIHLS